MVHCRFGQQNQTEAKSPSSLPPRSCTHKTPTHTPTKKQNKQNIMANLVRLDLADQTIREQEAHSKQLREVEIRARASRIMVPTDVQEVRRTLRALGHPVTLFGEGEAERRDRLRSVLAGKAVDGEDVAYIDRVRLAMSSKKGGVPGSGSGDPSSSSSSSSSTTSLKKDELNKKTFYYPAKEDLQETRKIFSSYSFGRMTDRLRTSKRQRTEVGSSKPTKDVQQLYTDVASARVVASQVGGARTVASVAFAPDGADIVTGSWDGDCQVWDRKSCLVKYVLKGHTERVTSVAYCPTDDGRTIASGSVDGTAMLWRVGKGDHDESNDVEMTDGADADQAARSSGVSGGVSGGGDATGDASGDASETNLVGREISSCCTFKGHKDRLGRICWHPKGKHLLTTSFDRTWRLWDVETGAELLTQEGHSRAVYGIATHVDGALVASTSLSGHGMVWDLRSGQSIMKLKGHAKPVLGCDFSPVGNVLATSSVDGTARVWDLRRHGRPLHVVAAHNHLVSSIRFAPNSGEYFVTSGYDSMLKMWSSRNGKRLAAWKGNEQMCMDVAIARDDMTMVTGGSDRTWKLIERVE